MPDDDLKIKYIFMYIIKILQKREKPNVKLKKTLAHSSRKFLPFNLAEQNKMCLTLLIIFRYFYTCEIDNVKNRREKNKFKCRKTAEKFQL